MVEETSVTHIRVEWLSEEARLASIRQFNTRDLREAIRHVRDQGREWSCLWELGVIAKLEQQVVRETLDRLIAQGFSMRRDGAWVYFMPFDFNGRLDDVARVTTGRAA